MYMVNSRSRCYAKEVKFMVAGHLQEKKGYFYMVLSYPDAAGKRKTKWLPTGLPVKGNKKKAEKMFCVWKISESLLVTYTFFRVFPLNCSAENVLL